MRRCAILLLCVVTTLVAGQGLDHVTLPVKSGSVRFAVIGDMGTGDAPQYEVARTMMGAHQDFPFDFVITLGDNLYGGSRPRDFEVKFEVPYRPLMDAGVKFFASLGNHDGASERSYKFFNMNGQSYYTFRRGNVRFFALNSNYMDRKQLEWLETQLRDAGGSDWKVCFFHHSLYSSARFHGPAAELRQLLEPLFIRFHVNVVFAGHDHVYERVRPQHDIYYFTEGASGQLRRGGLRPSAVTDKGFDADRSFMLVEIAGEEMYFRTVSRAGATVDAGSLRRQQE